MQVRIEVEPQPERLIRNSGGWWVDVRAKGRGNTALQCGSELPGCGWRRSCMFRQYRPCDPINKGISTQGYWLATAQ